MTLTPTVTLTPTPSLTPTPTFPRDAVVNIEALNVRAGPNVLHPLLGVAYRATAVAVEGRDLDGGWLVVRLPDQTTGWLNGAYVELRKDLGRIPWWPRLHRRPRARLPPFPWIPACRLRFCHR